MPGLLKRAWRLCIDEFQIPECVANEIVHVALSEIFAGTAEFRIARHQKEPMGPWRFVVGFRDSPSLICTPPMVGATISSVAPSVCLVLFLKR